MKIRMSVRLVAVVAIAAVMMLSSYAVAEQLSPEDEDAVFANATIDTYKCNQTLDMNTSIEMKGNVTGEIDVITTFNGSHIANITNETVRDISSGTTSMNSSITRNTTGRMVELVPTETETVEYLRINDSLYTVYPWNPKLPVLLGEMGYPESYERFWKSQGLLNSSDVGLLADETVDGVDCNVLRIVPDTETFWEIVINQSEKYIGLQNLLGIDNQSITAVSTTQWIAKDTGFPQKSQTTLKTVRKLEGFDVSDKDEEFTMTRDITMEMQFSDYNEPEPDTQKGPL
ncbi:hypothetical protein C5S53_08135 [Methanophagales archaeon]|nr:hypothetical protein C5S53_08135 [Methanophagales archaeon]